MAESKDTPPARGILQNWLGAGGVIALLLASLMLLLAWQRATDERHAAGDVKARVAAEMNRIEAEANRMEREAAQ